MSLQKWFVGLQFKKRGLQMIKMPAKWALLLGLLLREYGTSTKYKTKSISCPDCHVFLYQKSMWDSVPFGYIQKSNQTISKNDVTKL